jgi:hypothetical protein
VISTSQGGTAFTLRLPRRPAPRAAAPILDERHSEDVRAIGYVREPAER